MEIPTSSLSRNGLLRTRKLHENSYFIWIFKGLTEAHSSSQDLYAQKLAQLGRTCQAQPALMHCKPHDIAFMEWKPSGCYYLLLPIFGAGLVRACILGEGTEIGKTWEARSLQIHRRVIGDQHPEQLISPTSESIITGDDFFLPSIRNLRCLKPLLQSTKQKLCPSSWLHWNLQDQMEVTTSNSFPSMIGRKIDVSSNPLTLSSHRKLRDFTAERLEMQSPGSGMFENLYALTLGWTTRQL